MRVSTHQTEKTHFSHPQENLNKHKTMQLPLAHFSLTFTLLTTLSFPHHSFTSSLPSSTDLIDQTCRLTPFYDLCISSLRNNPQSPSADAHGLVAIIVADLLQNANSTLSNIQEMISHSPLDPGYERPLAYCAEDYIPIVKYTLPQAIEALQKGEYGFAIYGIMVAEKGVVDCENRVGGGGGGDFEAVMAWSEVVRKLADVALAIIKVLR